jgi:hypothetical protein
MLAINVYCYYVHNDHRKVTFFDIIGSGIALFVQQMDAINTKLCHLPFNFSIDGT